MGDTDHCDELFDAWCRKLIDEENETLSKALVEPGNSPDYVKFKKLNYWPIYVTKTFIESEPPLETNGGDVLDSNACDYKVHIDLDSFDTEIFDLRSLSELELFPVPKAYHATVSYLEERNRQLFQSLPLLDVPIKTPLLFLLLKGTREKNDGSQFLPQIPLREVVIFYSNVVHYLVNRRDMDAILCGVFGEITESQQKICGEHDSSMVQLGESLYNKLSALPFCKTLAENILEFSNEFRMSDKDEASIEGICEEFVVNHQLIYIEKYLQSLEKTIWKLAELPGFPPGTENAFIWSDGFIPTHMVHLTLLADCLNQNVKILKFKNRFFGHTPSGERSFDIRRAKKSREDHSLLSKTLPVPKFAMAQLCSKILHLENGLV